MISKELLRVLYPIDETSEIYVDLQKDNNGVITNRVMYFGKEYKDCRSAINIYEVANTCKEWIENNTYWDLLIIGYEVYLMEDIWGEGGATTHKRFTKEREWYLNLFKAAEYILEQKGEL